MNESLMDCVCEDLVNCRGCFLETNVVKLSQLFATSCEVPIRARFPKVSGFYSHEVGMKICKPIDAGPHCRGVGGVGV